MELTPNAVQWFQSYLSHRKQRTPCGNEISDPLPFTYGVRSTREHPGALNFPFYVNDLPTVVNHCSVSLYADDTVFYCFSSNIKDLENALNEDMSRIALWPKQNKLILNIEKTKSMIIGSDRKLRAATATSVSVFDEEVESVEHFKYLGVTLSSNFTWTEQIEYVKSLFPLSARILFITVSFSRSLIMPTLFGGIRAMLF